MCAIDFTPHLLRRCVVTEEYEDENGDWHEGSEQWCEEEIPCHAVPSGQANIINYEDGSTATYSFTVGRLAPDIDEFTVGEKVMLFADGIWREYHVKGFHRWQFQSKIWV